MSENKNSNKTVPSNSPTKLKLGDSIFSKYSDSQPTPEIFSDATNRLLSQESPSKTYSASQPEPAASIMKKGQRKSLNGRRVSFAPQAHVRVIIENQKDLELERLEREREEEREKEERELEEFRRQFTNDDYIAPPRGKSVTNESNTSDYDNNYGNNTRVDELKNSFSDFVIKSSPIAASSSTKRSYSTISHDINQSYDVELRCDEQPSFSSYISPEKDMDLTGCVGNILDDLTSSPLSNANSRRVSQMDFTNCVGSIIAQINRENPTAKLEVTESELELDGEDMEMTQSVGNLVSVSAAVEGESAAEISLSLENTIQADSTEMEMTQPVGSLLLNTGKENVPVIQSEAQHDVSFIGDASQPGAFNFISSPAKSALPELHETVETTKKHSLLSQNEESSIDLSVLHPNEYFTGLTNSQVNDISEAVDKESIKIASEALHRSNSSINDNAKKMLNLFSLPEPAHTAIISHVTDKGNSAISVPASSNTSSQPLIANLKEFLNDTGVRFLDNLSNMGRRETVGKPRDSTIITPSRRVYIESVMIPETLAIERACAESVRTIEAQREFLMDEEGKFNHHPPLAYREFLAVKNNSESTGESNDRRALLLQKLKTIKSVARLFARQSWYEWRRGFESGFFSELEHVLASMKNVYNQLENEKNLIESTSINFDSIITSLTSELSQLRSRYDSLNRCDWREANELHAQVLKERSNIQELDSEMAEIIGKESELRGNIESILEQRKYLQERILSLKHANSQFEDCTELALSELKSTFALQEALNGWKLVQLRSDSITCEYTRGSPMAPVLIRMNFSPDLMVTSVLLESESSALPTLRPASQLFYPTFASLPRSLANLMSQLDLLVQLGRDLNMIKVQCDVQLLTVMETTSAAEVNATPTSETGLFASLPLLLTFFNFDAKIKFDVILSVALRELASSPTLVYKFLSFSNHYGPVLKDDIIHSMQGINDLRKIVNAIYNLLK